MQTELAQTIVGQLTRSAHGWRGGSDGQGGRFRREVQAAEKGGTKNVEAHQHYLQGRFYANRHSEKGATQALAEYRTRGGVGPALRARLGRSGRDALVVLRLFQRKVGRAGFDAHLAGARARPRPGRLTLEPRPAGGVARRADIQLNFDFDWNGAATTRCGALFALAPADPAICYRGRELLP